MDPGALTIATDLVDGSALITVVGDVDLASAPRLRSELEAALRRFRTVIVDVADLSFIDSSGLNALVKARGVAQETGGELRFRRPTPMFLELLRITRLQTVFVIDDLDGGPADISPRPLP